VNAHIRFIRSDFTTYYDLRDKSFERMRVTKMNQVRLKATGQEHKILDLIEFLKMRYKILPDYEPRPDKYGTGVFIYLTLEERD
jgi:hypothetical protein